MGGGRVRVAPSNRHAPFIAALYCVEAASGGRIRDGVHAMWGITTLGLAAGFCTSFALLPQVIKTWRTRSTGDISLGMFLVMALGLALWLIYGLIIGDAPLIAANTVTLLFAVVILFFKLRGQ